MDKERTIVISDIQSVGTIPELIRELLIAREKGARVYEVSYYEASAVKMDSSTRMKFPAIRCTRTVNGKELLEMERADLEKKKNKLSAEISELDKKIESHE